MCSHIATLIVWNYRVCMWVDVGGYRQTDRQTDVCLELQTQCLYSVKWDDSVWYTTVYLVHAAILDYYLKTFWCH